jgi:hypothetical protein
MRQNNNHTLHNGYKNRQELARELGMSARTMNRKMKHKTFKIGHQGLLSPKEQDMIKKALDIEPCPKLSK